MQHIFHVSSPLSWRGGEQQLLYLATELQRLGIKQTVFCPCGSVLAVRALEAKLTVVTYKKRGGTDILAAFQLCRLVKKQPLALVHAHDAHAHTTVWLAATFCRMQAKIVVHRRVAFPISKKWITQKKYRSQNIDAFIAISKDVKTCLLAAGVEAAKVELIYSGVNTQRPLPNTGKLRAELQIPAAAKIIGCVGALTEQKDPITFLNWAKTILSASKKEVHFVWLGEGHLRPIIEQFIVQFSLRQNVHFLGFKPDVAPYLIDFDAFFCTSVNEGLGTALLDAMVLNVPLIALDAPGVREAVPFSGQGGQLFASSAKNDIKNALLEVVEHGKNEILAERAKAWVQQFDYSITASETLKLYNRLITSC